MRKKWWMLGLVGAGGVATAGVIALAPRRASAAEPEGDEPEPELEPEPEESEPPPRAEVTGNELEPGYWDVRMGERYVLRLDSPAATFELGKSPPDVLVNLNLSPLNQSRTPPWNPASLWELEIVAIDPGTVVTLDFGPGGVFVLTGRGGLTIEPSEPTPEEPPPQVSGSIDIERYENPDNYPQGGRFHQVTAGETLLGEDPQTAIVYRWLADEAFRTAKNRGLSDDDARAFARRIAGNGRIRMDAYNLLLCSPWNDAVFATWGYGGQALPGPTGRAMRLLPIHADTRARLRRAEPPLRNIELGAPGDAGSGSAGPVDPALRSFEYPWLPPLDRRDLWSSVVSVDPEPWPDAPELFRSRIFPPPVVSRLEIAALESLAGRQWGCNPWAVQYG